MNRGPKPIRPFARLSIAAHLFRHLCGLLALCSLGALAAPCSAADDKPAEKAPPANPAAANNANVPLNRGMLIKVPLPLTGNADTKIRDEVNRFLKKQDEAPAQPAGNRADPRPILILELSPGQSEFGRGTDYGKARDLARFLSSRELDGIRTVAYIPHTIKGHGVLLALACQSLVMAPDAEIGDAGIDEESIGPEIRSGYSEIAARHNTIPPAVALGMLDKNLTVYKIVIGGVNGGGTKFVLEDELKNEEKKEQILSKTELRRPGLFSGQEASPTGLGFASYLYLAKDRAALAAALNLPPDAVRERPSGAWIAKRIDITEPINAKSIEKIMISLHDQIDTNNANFILIVLDTAGGSPENVPTLANYLAGLDPGKVETVAFISNQACSEAAMIAMACDHIVMKNGTTIGGAGNTALSKDQSRILGAVYQEVAKAKNRSWSLGAAMVDPEYRVFHYTYKGRDYYFSPEELKEQEGGGAGYVQAEEITRPGVLLRLNSERASQLGIAEQVANYHDVQKLFGLDYDPPAVEPGWAITLLRALASPRLAWLLLMVGGCAFFLELHSPGIGLGGFIAFICFLIYFWGQHLNGTAGWLEVMLFASGVVCLLIELFIIPGAAIFGLGGGLMILTSLILASQTFVIPRNEYQIEQFRDTLLSLAAAGAGMIGIGFITRRFLPRAPGFNRMLLAPPTNQEIAQTAEREALVDYRRFANQKGRTATPLAPSGKAHLNGELVDVISLGDFIDRDVEIVVADVQGNRVIVRRAE
ncbi:MAG TPA: NfeD family protein [Pirellulales bacterium]|jgi:membrane-bound serine protease (ClpP class)|nr:NfeD family protein [Pirellulales bacterium]